ncbi:MAG: glycosyltransferase [Flavobacteriales bacterium]|nr:glycosyltransferase [Flavobacteriales bacterium]
MSICCITYNHAAYIREALDGFVQQRTTFPIEVIVHDDASTDGTADIIRQYVREHPGLFKPILQTENQYSKQRGLVTRNVFRAAKAPFIAWCEGDDHWTDPLKLQKQVDFLQANEAHVMCFHRAMLLKQGRMELHAIPEGVDLRNVRVEDLLAEYNFIATGSIVFRNITSELPDWFWGMPFGDLALYIFLGSRGRIACLPDTMSVYRLVGDGAWSGRSKKQQRMAYLEFYDRLLPHVDHHLRELVRAKRASVLDAMAADIAPGSNLLRGIARCFLQIRHR